MVAQIAKVLEPLLQSTFEHSIIKDVQKSLTKTINTELNEKLAVYGTQAAMPFDANIIADYGMVDESPKIADNILHIDVNGTFFNAKSNKPSKLHPADFSKVKTAGKEVWAIVSWYTLETLAMSGFNKLGTQFSESGYSLGLIVERTYNRLLKSKDETLTVADLITELNKQLKGEFQLPSVFNGIDLQRVWIEVHLGEIAVGLKPTKADWLAIGSLLSSAKEALEPSFIQF